MHYFLLVVVKKCILGAKLKELIKKINVSWKKVERMTDYEVEPSF